MTALGGPSEADDERASAAPPVEREKQSVQVYCNNDPILCTEALQQLGSLFTGRK